MLGVPQVFNRPSKQYENIFTQKFVPGSWTLSFKLIQANPGSVCNRNFKRRFVRFIQIKFNTLFRIGISFLNCCNILLERLSKDSRKYYCGHNGGKKPATSSTKNPLQILQTYSSKQTLKVSSYQSAKNSWDPFLEKLLSVTMLQTMFGTASRDSGRLGKDFLQNPHKILIPQFLKTDSNKKRKT